MRSGICCAPEQLIFHEIVEPQLRNKPQKYSNAKGLTKAFLLHLFRRPSRDCTVLQQYGHNFREVEARRKVQRSTEPVLHSTVQERYR